jgi:uroporphyrinogen-III synthase
MGGFDGLRVLALETRRSAEIGTLIRKEGGEPILAPSVRERAIDDNDEAFHFFNRLTSNGYDLIILTTGVGTRALGRMVDSKFGEGSLAAALKKVAVVARGPKPMSVLREWGVPAAVNVPEPNTWREILEVMQHRPEWRVVVQEYGTTNERLIDGLRAMGKDVETVRVYEYDLPEDTGPLREAARRVAAGEIDIALFTTSAQIRHLVHVARDDGIERQVSEGLRRAVVASIGPTTSESLEEFGFVSDIHPSHPKMGLLVNETAAQARNLLQGKRQ